MNNQYKQQLRDKILFFDRNRQNKPLPLSPRVNNNKTNNAIMKFLLELIGVIIWLLIIVVIFNTLKTGEAIVLSIILVISAVGQIYFTCKSFKEKNQNNQDNNQSNNEI